MTLDNIIESIKLLTVKVEMNNNTNKENGTGVLIIQNNKAYVLTVYHCIYGKGESPHIVKSENILFKFDSKISEEVIRPLNMEKYKEVYLAKNIVLLEVDISKLKIDGIKNLLLLDRVFYDKSYYLRGYPKVLSYDHYFEAKCRDKDLDEVTFKIEVDGLTNDTSGDDANELISGLSGSGVFFSENNQLYLVGLVNALATEGGTFNAVHCIKLLELKDTDIKLSERLVFKNLDIDINEIESVTLPYINQLIKAYNSEGNESIEQIENINNSQYDSHFKRARRSFYMVEQLRMFSRDNLNINAYEDFQDEVYEYIINTVEKQYDNAFCRVIATEDKSIDIKTDFYPIEGKKCKTIEKKGVCHHLVNDKEISWIEDE